MSYQIAFIGYGFRSETMMTAFRSIDADISVAAVCDPRETELRKRTAGDPMFASTTYYTDAAEMLDAVKPDGVFVGTPLPIRISISRSCPGISPSFWRSPWPSRMTSSAISPQLGGAVRIRWWSPSPCGCALWSRR